MSKRVSLDEDAIAAIARESDHFGTTDLSKLIIGICAERRLLIQIHQPLQPAENAPKPKTDATLDELAELLQ